MWAFNFDQATNRISNSSREYGAEGEGKTPYSSGQWQYPTYNALGQRVQEYQGTATDSMTLSYPIDIFGQRTGAFAQWPSQGSTGWNVYWSQVAGQRLNMGGVDARAMRYAISRSG